ncbi:MAG: biotin--[acetyl-CoA-carboxylase] ligase [Treponema sp.]|nr:biotin--[acetyl-CoA-carboxylase] ligase [Treponema sp.]
MEGKEAGRAYPVREIPAGNPFGAPVFHLERTGSTMDASRFLAGRGAGHGTVICADFQESSRARGTGRSWDSGPCRGLLFTVLLRFGETGKIPPALSLRMGLAVAQAVEDFAPALSGLAKIKWPNDLMLPVGNSWRKAAGMLAEAEGGTVHVGVGLNFLRMEFPPELREKAGSLADALEEELLPESRFRLLALILARLHAELENAELGESLQRRLQERLYLLGRAVTFAEGGTERPELVRGILRGIARDGSLLIAPEGGGSVRACSVGELLVYGN